MQTVNEVEICYARALSSWKRDAHEKLERCEERMVGIEGSQPYVKRDRILNTMHKMA